MTVPQRVADERDAPTGLVDDSQWCGEPLVISRRPLHQARFRHATCVVQPENVTSTEVLASYPELHWNLTRGTMARLDYGKWVSDDIIYAFLYLLQVGWAICLWCLPGFN